ncbi:FIG00554508: hypothetical protein [Cronobacter turicensis 564]|nr:FIG00554508: hypothetical protein [Cronobacter turicensis 564]
MRELCANTIYKFVNRFSFVAKEVVAATRPETANFACFTFIIINLTRFYAGDAACHFAHSAPQHKINN